MPSQILIASIGSPEPAGPVRNTWDKKVKAMTQDAITPINHPGATTGKL